MINELRLKKEKHILLYIIFVENQAVFNENPKGQVYVCTKLNECSNRTECLIQSTMSYLNQ